jgi:predicted nucleic acid-binding protein
MAFLLDTNVAIHLRDGNSDIIDRVAALGAAVQMSIISRVELENGVYRTPSLAAPQRARVDAILASIPALAFDNSSADAYRAIIARAGYSRRKMLDRMIAAQAVVHSAALVTMNASDFADIPDLQILAW